ncbi:MAG: phosphoglycerate kinase [Candidatus Margulisbacteria bacterium]|nr:phosphoglycerate kinase [Candidatus Margulisiibacteriota bacterium]
MNTKIIAGDKEIVKNELNKAGIPTLTNFLKQTDVAGKTIGMRLELNVAWAEKDGQLIIKDAGRIEKAWPDLKAAILAGANIAIMYHVEDKKKILGTSFKDNALIYDYISNKIAGEIGSHIIVDRVKENKFAGDEAMEKLSLLKQSKINVLLLQNVRIDDVEREMEKKNKTDLVVQLADIFDVYVDCGTGLMHRNGATNLGIKLIMKALGKQVVAGDIFVKDTADLQRLINAFNEDPEHSIAFFAGAKIANTYDAKGKLVEAGKITILKSFIELGIKSIALGGKMVNPFLVAMGKSAGAAPVSEEEVELARQIIEAAEKNKVKLLIPTDFATVHKDELQAVFEGKPVNVKIEKEISADRFQVDIGPETAINYYGLVKSNLYRLWNGPMGVYEHESLATGTNMMGKAFKDATTGFGIFGGGDTGDSVKHIIDNDTPNTKKLAGGGGPMEFISCGGNLPTIEAMKIK